MADLDDLTVEAPEDVEGVADELAEPGAALHQDVAATDELVVVVPADGEATRTAQALLDAAVAKGYPESVVQTSDGAFHVPADVADAAELPENAGRLDGRSGALESDLQNNEGSALAGPDDDSTTKPADRREWNADRDAVDPEAPVTQRETVRPAAKKAAAKRAAAKH